MTIKFREMAHYYYVWKWPRKWLGRPMSPGGQCRGGQCRLEANVFFQKEANVGEVNVGEANVIAPFLHSISTICQRAENILELCIRIQIQINLLLIFTEKFSPLPVPSRYANDWAILAWMRSNSLIIIFLVFQVITASEFHPRECSLFVYSSSKGTIRLCDMRQAALCDSHAKCKLPITILSAIVPRNVSCLKRL